VQIAQSVKFAVLLIVIITAEPARAQEKEPRGFIGLGIGPSAPLGSFAEASSSDSRTGPANSGYTDSFLNLGYRFRQHLGVAATFSYSEYTMHSGVSEDWWQVAVVTVGPMYSLPLGPRAALDLKAMAGLMALTPVVASFTTDDGTGSGLGVDMRAAVRYDVFRQWAVFAEAGMQAAGVSYNSGSHTSYRALISGLGVAFRPAW
jgi:outer membrane protein with beta-barrel domain